MNAADTAIRRAEKTLAGIALFIMGGVEDGFIELSGRAELAWWARSDRVD